MYIYAELNENNICIGLKVLSGRIDEDRSIQVEFFDQNLLWRKYENGQWSAEKFEPQSTAPLTEFEQLKSDQEAIKQSIAELSFMLATPQA